jgi:competence protein ComEC
MKPWKYYLNRKFTQLRKLWLYIHHLHLPQLCVGICFAILTSYLHIWIPVVLGILILLLGKKSWSLLAIGILCGSTIYWSWFNPALIGSRQSLYGEKLTLKAEVVSDPVASEFNQQVVINDSSLPSLVQLDLPLYPRLIAGQLIEVTAVLQNPQDKYDSGYVTYLNSQNIFYISSSTKYELLEEESALDYAFARLRNKLQSQITKHVTEPEASLLSGILFGVKQQLSPEFKQDLSATGTSHIVAVSGYNVMLVVAGCLSIAGYLPRKLVFILTSICLIAFLLLVGIGNLSAQRAVIMGGMLLISLFSGRKGSLPLSLLYAVTAMLISFPLVWLSISWQLSVGAMLGLILLSNTWNKAFNRLPGFARESLSASLAVMITLPIVLGTFGQVSFISLLANLLILPAIPLITYLGLLGLVTSFIAPAIATPIFIACELALKALVHLIHLLAGVQWGSTKNLSLGAIFFICIWLTWLASDYFSFTRNLKLKDDVES